MSEQTKNYWFPAKTYGWGWGLPTAWQGWVVIVLFVGLVAAVGVVFPPKQSLLEFVAMVSVLSALLIAVCWKTGEPPKWRWGK